MMKIKNLFRKQKHVQDSNEFCEDVRVNAAREMMPLILKKYEGEHPTKEEMISFVKKYKDVLSYEIVREYEEDNPFYDHSTFVESPCSYMQYLVLRLKSPSISVKTSLSISTLPWKEITDLLGITEKEAREKWVPEYPEDDEDYDEDEGIEDDIPDED